jgi:Tol biopolymer transport system component
MGKHVIIIWMISLLLLVVAGCQQKTSGNEAASEGRIACIANYMEGHEHYSNYIVSMDNNGNNQVELVRWSILSDGHSHLWSKDGTSFAYLEGDELVSGIIQTTPSWLVIASADGSERRRLLDLGGLEVSSMSLSPDGKTVLLECQVALRSLTSGETSSPPIHSDPWYPGLYSVDVATGEYRRLIADADIGVRYPVFSPDGTKIAFLGATIVWVEQNQNGVKARYQDPSQSKQGIYVMNSNGSELQKLIDYQPTGFPGGPDRLLVWSPDSKKILYSQLDVVTRYADLFTVDVINGQVVKLTNSPHAYDSDYSWSPDGKRIVFTSSENITLNAGLFVYGVYIMDADGRNVVKVGDSLTQPSWFPDGKQIIAVSRVTDDAWAIVTLNLQGNNMKTIIQSAGSKYVLFRYPIWLSKY